MQKKEAIEKYLDAWGGDGHSIIKAESLVKMGFDFDFVARFAIDHQSGKDLKEMIFDPNTGEKLDELFGVNSLSFAYAIAKDVSADLEPARSKMGRGFQARALVDSIKEVIS